MEKKSVRITRAMRNLDAIALLQGQQAPNGSTIQEVIAHLLKENEILSKRSASATKKPTKTQEENEILKPQILELLQSSPEGATATEVMNAFDLTSNQKAAALLRSLCDAGLLHREKRKGKMFFLIGPEEE